MNWNDLRFFLAVARHGGLSSAANRLETSPSRVSRRIDALENALGVPLFLRSLDGYRLTDEGLAFVPRAEAVEAAALALSGKAAICAGVAGRVRLATAENIATRLIAPALPGFLSEHPNLKLDLVTGIRSVDLARHEADLALRLTRPSSGEILIRKLGHMACAVYRAVDAEPSDCVAWGDAMSELPAAKALAALKAPVAVVAHTLALHHELAASGAVWAILPCFIGDRDLRLRRASDPLKAAGQDIWLAINRDVSASARVRAVADFLDDLVQQNAHLLDGSRPAANQRHPALPRAETTKVPKSKRNS